MATKYLIAGGTGNWSSDTNWSTTSGGANDTTKPVDGDAVICDAASTAITLTVDTSSACTSIVFTGFVGTFAGSAALQVKGNITAVAGMTWTNTSTVTVANTSGTATITSAGKTMGPLTMNGAGGTVTFADAFVTTGTCTLTAGTWNDGNVNLTMAAWVNTGSTTRVIVYGTSNTWYVTGSGTCWNESGTLCTANAATRQTAGGKDGVSTIDFTYSGASSRTLTRDSEFAWVMPKVKVSAGSGTFTMGAAAGTRVGGLYCHGLDFTGFSGTYTPAATSGGTYYYYWIVVGDCTLSASMTLTACPSNAQGQCAFVGSRLTAGENVNITMNGQTIPMTGAGVGYGTWLNPIVAAGTVTLADNFATTDRVSFNIGTGLGAVTATANVTCSLFDTSTTTTRTLNMGSGTWTLTSTAATTVWNMATTTGLTLNPGTATIDLTGVTANTRTLTSNSVLMPKLKISAGSGAVTCTNGNYNGIEMTTGYTGTFANQTISFRGDVSLSSAATYTAGANAWTYVGTSGTCLFNSNGKTVDWPITVNGIGGTLQQAANLAMGATRTLTLTRGTFNSAGYTNNVTAVLMNGTAGTTTLGSAGTSWTCNLTCNGASGTLTFADAFVTTGTCTHTAGTILQGNFDLTFASYSSTGTGTRVFNYAASNVYTVNITGSGSCWTVTGASGYSNNVHTLLLSGGHTGVAVTKFTYSGGAARTFTYADNNSGAYWVCGSIWISAGSGTFTGASTSYGIQAGGDLNFTGFSGTYTGATAANAWALGASAGSVTLSTTMTITASNGGFLWYQDLGSPVSTHTFTSNGKAVPVAAGYSFISGPTGAGAPNVTFSFADAFSTTGSFNHGAGTLDLNGQSLTALTFISSNANVRAITFGAATLTLTSTAAASVFDTSTSTNLTMNAGTGTIDLTGVTTNVRTITANSVLLPTIKLSGGTGAGSVTLTNVNCAGLTFASTYACTGFANQSVTIRGPVTLSNHASFALTAGANAWTLASTSGSNAFTSQGKTVDFPITVNGVGGTHAFADAFTHGITRTLTLTNGTLGFGTGLTHTLGFLASSNANVRTIDTGTSTLQFPTTGAVWDTSTSTNLTLSGTGTLKLTDSSGTARSITAGTKRLPSLWVSAGTSTTTLTNVTGCIDLSMAGMGAGTIAAGAGAFAIGGSVTFVAAGTWSYTGNLTFDATATGKTITSAGKAWTSGTVTFSGSGGGWTLQDAPVTFTSGNALTVAVGHLNTNGFAVTTPALVFSGSGVRELTLGASVVSLTGTGTIFDASGSNQTVNAGTSTLDCTDGTSTAKTFRTGGKVLNLIKVKKSTTNVFNFRDGGTMNLSLAA